MAQGIELPANAFDNGTVRHGTDSSIEIRLRNLKLFILFLRHSILAPEIHRERFLLDAAWMLDRVEDDVPWTPDPAWADLRARARPLGRDGIEDGTGAR